MRQTFRQTFLVVIAFALLLIALLGGQLYSDASLVQAKALFQSPIPTLPNDNFGRAQRINTLPIVAPSNLTNATLQGGEPLPTCADRSFTKTIWFVYTPAANGAVVAALEGWDQQVLAVYTGGTLRDLSQVACLRAWGSTPITVQAGVTYYFQVGDNYGYGGPITFRLNVAPPVQPSISFSPFEPSIYDMISFNGFANDPLSMSITSYNWNFGDGNRATGQWVTHQYTADGDYPVRLTVRTSDGRVGSTTTTLAVRTRDVYITRIVRPRTAVTGATKRIIVTLGNQRYPQNVRIELLRSVSGGYTQLGTSTQFVDINRTTDFYFSHTFTAADAQIGKVTFKAIATIIDGRDALPADNEFISLPVLVSAPTGRSDEQSLALDDLSQHDADVESNKAADGPTVAAPTESNEPVTKEEAASPESAPGEMRFQLFIPVASQQ
jgi:PKD repeat protein